MSGDFNSLDIEHKRELLFNSIALYQTLNKVAELTGMDRQQVIFALYGAIEPTINGLSDIQLNEHIETMEAVFQNPEQFIIEGEIKK